MKNCYACFREEPEYKPAPEHGLQEIDVREYGYQLSTDTDILYALTHPILNRVSHIIFSLDQYNHYL